MKRNWLKKKKKCNNKFDNSLVPIQRLHTQKSSESMELRLTDLFRFWS